MRYKRLVNKETNEQVLAANSGNNWEIIKDRELTLLALLAMPLQEVDRLEKVEIGNSDSYQEIIPLKPTAYRDFMLYEKHAIDAARGFVKKYMPNIFPIVNAFEIVFRKPFPMLKPKKRFYKYPICYLGNHLNFVSENDTISIPTYTKELDYELELAAIITKPLKNASIEEVNDAIGGFMILNDFSARDVQLDEINSGFGLMKTKNFASAISIEVVSKEFLIDKIDDLAVKVIINGKTIVESNSKGKAYSFQEAIAYASWEEQLHPGELFGSGTIPGCTGIENGTLLNKGDSITLKIEGIGTLTNKII